MAKKISQSVGKKITKGYTRPEGAGNFDNMDDYNIVDSIDVNHGRVQDVPAVAKDIVNKEYVDGLTTYHPHQDVKTTASPTFDELTATKSTNDMKFTSTLVGGAFGFQPVGTVGSIQMRYQFFPSGGDLSNTIIDIYGVGSSTDVTGSHRMSFGYASIRDEYVVSSNAAKNLNIKSSTDEQILVKTDGTVEFNAGEVAFAHEINTKDIQTVGLIYASGNIEGANLTTRSALNLKNSGAVINWDEGDITLTHSNNTLTFAGMNLLDLGNSDIEMGGDLIFVGNGSGLSYGCLDGTDETVTCTTQNTWYQVTFDTAGVNNNTTPSTAQNHITINETGDYQTNVIACLHTANAQDIEILVKKENGTVDLGIHLYQTTGVAGKVENSAGGCLLPISATDTMELWVRCTSAGTVDVIFDHVSLSCSQVGG